MGESHRYMAMIGSQEVYFETGKLAEQAGGAVTIRMGDTLLLATATMSARPREGIDFFPLSVDYEERLYAAGRIPGSFFRREGRPGEGAILNARVTDRPLRPLFPKTMRNEVQIILTALSHDQEHYIDMLCINGASAALTISDIPFDGPVGACRIGLIDGQLIVNPTISEMADSTLDLRLAGTADAVNMVECGAEEVDEETMVKALELGHAAIQHIISVQKQMAAEVGKTKFVYEPPAVDEALEQAVSARVVPEIKRIVAEITDRTGRNEAVDALRDQVLAEYEATASEDVPPDYAAIRGFIQDVLKAEVRRRIIEDGVRPDGRDYTTIRPLAAEVAVIPRVHGSGLFKRGQTQVLSIATLGTPRDEQMLDDLTPEESKRYMHHYNFPPYSTGETWFLRGPKRREIGHGALAEAALRPMIPPEDEFPYTLRVVSEVLSSNGSSSMASVCGSTLALMDAGVPIVRPVAGIAMGLIKEDERYAILTDIQ
ncbi:MAG: polyribonucleotide nucleotidyltransferase, partial [Anaerolineae bacterium]|nr:polyribonucleotide nucleotidyltransferase [Anaerolineae bacterium]